MIAARITGAMEHAEVLDRVSGPVHERVAAVLGSPARARLLQGAWLGHPVHPVLTDIPIGCWTSAWVLDVFGSTEQDDTATWFVGLGVLAAVPTAITGWASWLRLSPELRRVGVVHAAANSVATALYAASWKARRSGNRWRGVRLAHAGATVATVGGFLGGHLALRSGDEPPTRTPAGRPAGR